MIQLRSRSEYSFRTAIGSLDEVASQSTIAAALTDRGGCWGHYKWKYACEKAGVKPIYGVELCVVFDSTKDEIQPKCYTTFLAKNNVGLSEIYELVKVATSNFYYEPRLDVEIVTGVSENVFVLLGENASRVFGGWVGSHSHRFFQIISPNSNQKDAEFGLKLGIQPIACSDPAFPTQKEFSAYEGVMGAYRESSTNIRHYVTAEELIHHAPKNCALRAAILNTSIAYDCNATLEKAPMLTSEDPRSLEEIALKSCINRNLDSLFGLNKRKCEYWKRFDHEMNIIEEKNFSDYFKIVADLIDWSKKQMLVGPARGSSCGSLVCYMLGITDVDPIKYNLLFERFVDVNRMDWPDIDIDLQDDKRHLAIEYLQEKYGHDNVAKLGTVSFFKPKSALLDVSKAMDIPPWSVESLKESIVERNSGDERATKCLEDAFLETSIGKSTISKFPELHVACKVEGRARHSGVHAAGVIVTNDPITKYGAFDMREGVIQMDKEDAEGMNLLKIDCLGLRTLTVIASCLEQIGWAYEDLLAADRENEEAFQIINDGKFAGVFQFEGETMMGVCKKTTITSFEDYVAITSLARPGPLASGGADKYLQRKNGEEVIYLHPLMEEATRSTYGILVYQEQVLQIARKIGKLSWSDASKLRKALSKSKGKDAMDVFWQKFKAGAQEQGINEETAQEIWDEINTFGSYGFNRSHAVAYALMSYWCCLLKAKFPLQFSAACLQSAKDDAQSIAILREVTKEGIDYIPFDREKSLASWSVQDGTLVGGLTGIKGVGQKMAETIIKKRTAGEPLTASQEKMMSEGKTPWDEIWPQRALWGHILAEPHKYNIETKIFDTKDLTDQSIGKFLLLVEIKEMNIRDLNDAASVKRRGRKVRGQSKYVDLLVSDDTGEIKAGLDRFKHEETGVHFFNNSAVGEWHLVLGVMKGGFRKLNVLRTKKLTGNKDYDN